MSYIKPNKQERNELYLREIGFEANANPYEENVEPQAKLFLIVCEGLNTEPEYFKSFPVPTNSVITIGGMGSRTSLVKATIKLVESGEYENHEVWCVFDFDIKPDEGATQPRDFNNAIKLAQENGFKVAWSNDAFELWFVLHYHELDNALSRHELYPILKEAWGLKSFSATAKTKEFCEGIYLLQGGDRSASQKLAIRRAKKLHKLFLDGKVSQYHKQCPCTTVYLLVETLNKQLKP